MKPIKPNERLKRLKIEYSLERSIPLNAILRFMKNMGNRFLNKKKTSRG